MSNSIRSSKKSIDVEFIVRLKKNISPQHNVVDNTGVYSVYLLIRLCYELKVKVVQIKLSDLEYLIKQLIWKNIETNQDLSPEMVLNNPVEHPDEYMRIKNADLGYPIILDSNYDFLDGLHRITKAYSEKREYIMAYIIDIKLLKYTKIAKNLYENKQLIQKMTHDKLDKIYSLIILKVKNSIR